MYILVGKGVNDSLIHAYVLKKRLKMLINGPSWHPHAAWIILTFMYGASTILFLTPGFLLEYDLHAQITC